MEYNKTNEDARALTYLEFPHYYVFDKKKKIWTKRKRGFAVGRMTHASPSSREFYYLRVLLTKVKGLRSYKEIRTVENIIYPTFKSACHAMGLLEDDIEYIDAIKEAANWALGHYLRKFFVNIVFSYAQKQQAALFEINQLLQANGKSLTDYPTLPRLEAHKHIDVTNHLIMHELNVNRENLQLESQKLISSLTKEQKTIFHSIMSSIGTSSQGFFFVYGYGGTGKTFLWNALITTIRAKGQIVLAVASSAIAATLLPSGRTAHSRFVIPIEINEDSICNIKHSSPLANLLRETTLIIWDEAPMIKRHYIEAFDRSLRDIMFIDEPFGGKCVVMGGDFQQILPVIPKGARADIVNASINSSYLWNSCIIFKLTKNMRLSTALTLETTAEINQFANWLLDVGDGNLSLPNDGMAKIEIPPELLITKYYNPLEAIVNSTYPDLLQHLSDSKYFNDRAILAPTIETVNQLNDYMCSLLPGQSVDYFSADLVPKIEQDNDSIDDLYTTKFLNTINCSGLPHINSL
ncbi:uncharacterized protein LOC129305588 [Prosopis cineraria]|uniref:uncharacterized protein LOC129305588 n=1 Tax=Prosopis cineraria TaxID=364024 RepID=UPI00241006DE|nr:uncharacterized protein LOC129305588 [Prosopis cineraria]